MDVIMLIVLGIYFQDQEVFLYASGIMTIIYGILGGLASKQYKVLVSSNFPELFEDFQYLEGLTATLGGILGAVFLIIIDTFFEMYLVQSLIIILIIMIIFQVYLYNSTWRDIERLSKKKL